LFFLRGERHLILKKYAIFVKILVSAGLLCYLLQRIDFEQLRDIFANLMPQFYALAAVLWCINIVVQATILKVLLSAKEISARSRDIIKMLVISNFFGIVLPGGVGSDVVLCYYLCKGNEKKKEALSAVIFSRLGATFIMVVIAFLFSFGDSYLRHSLNLVSAAMLIVGLAAYLLVLKSAPYAQAMPAGTGLRKYKWSSLAYDTLLTTVDFMRSRKILALTIPLFALVGTLRVLIDYSIAISIGLSVNLADFAMMIPWPSLALILPITVAGIGVRESAYVAALKAIDILPAQALSISTLSFSLTLLTCIAGAIIYATNRKQLISSTEKKIDPYGRI